MAVDAAAVAAALEITVDQLPAWADDEIASVVTFAAARYDAPADADQLAAYEAALVKQVCLRITNRRPSSAGDDRPSRPIGRFDWSVMEQLSDYRKAGVVA